MTLDELKKLVKEQITVNNIWIPCSPAGTAVKEALYSKLRWFQRMLNEVEK